MSQIRLYLDEDTIRKTLVQALRNAEIDVVTTSELFVGWATKQGPYL